MRFTCLLLLSPLVTPILALPSTTPNTASSLDGTMNCGFRPILPHHVDCSSFLHDFAGHPYMTGNYQYGPMQPFPGRTPVTLSNRNCQMILRIKINVIVHDAWFEKMRLNDYMERFWTVQTLCLQQGRVFNWGRVDVGVSGALEVLLSGKMLEGAKGLGNGTSLTIGNDGRMVNAPENAREAITA